MTDFQIWAAITGIKLGIAVNRRARKWIEKHAPPPIKQEMVWRNETRYRALKDQLDELEQIRDRWMKGKQ